MTLEELMQVAKTYKRLFRERTKAVERQDPGSIEWVPEDARVLFSELHEQHPNLTIHDRPDLQPFLDAARRDVKREMRREQ